VEDVERKVVTPNYAAMYYIYRLSWLLAAARDVKDDEGKRCAYVAEAKGLMVRATRGLRTLQSEDWNLQVRNSAWSCGPVHSVIR
jgi:hypothetical protein